MTELTKEVVHLLEQLDEAAQNKVALQILDILDVQMSQEDEDEHTKAILDKYVDDDGNVNFELLDSDSVPLDVDALFV